MSAAEAGLRAADYKDFIHKGQMFFGMHGRKIREYRHSLMCDNGTDEVLMVLIEIPLTMSEGFIHKAIGRYQDVVNSKFDTAPLDNMRNPVAKSAIKSWRNSGVAGALLVLAAEDFPEHLVELALKLGVLVVARRDSQYMLLGDATSMVSLM